jgi:preprotein translocase subunit YajC
LVEVLDGLRPGERVVTKGGLFIDQAAVPGST